VSAPKDDFRVPVPPRARESLQKLGKIIGSSLPPGWGFTLFIFSYGEGGTLTYTSSAQREDMLKVLQEFMRAQAS
jgi:hypothetical protein